MGMIRSYHLVCDSHGCEHFHDVALGDPNDETKAALKLGWKCFDGEWFCPACAAKKADG